MTTDQTWRGGDRVEVIRVVSGATVYFPANVITAPPPVRKKIVWVEHESLIVGNSSVHMKEYVSPTRLRPSPPRELITPRFKPGDDVDVFVNNEGCWVRGKVKVVVGDGNSRYIVDFNGFNRPEMEIDRFHLRLHREFINGSWTVVPSKNLFEKGAIVEVNSEEDSSSWYCAKIVCLVSYDDDDDKYIVEHLRFSNKSIPMKDLVKARYLRPVPPSQELSTYEPGDEVDAWFNKRWWFGTVCDVFGFKYSVCFVSTGEESIVPGFNLRPHKDWINGQWVGPEERLFEDGTMVEVRSDERGYEGSWFAAKIVNYLGKGRYIVEYQTLRTEEDETELLKEEARGSDIRPNPPLVARRACGYGLDEVVDAWFNDGWWSGRVYEINRNYYEKRYGVYFKTTNERLEFACDELRPCLVWRKGKWTRAQE